MPYQTNPVMLMFTVIVNADHTWLCFIGTKAVNILSLPGINITTIQTASDVQTILHTLQLCKICPGHPEEKFVSMVMSKKV